MITDKKLKIAIQGLNASFHDTAARIFFSNLKTPQRIESLECLTFRELFESLDKNQADLGVVAIENSIAGSILPNYILLEQFRFYIVGEIWMRIELHLMGLSGQNLSELHTVQSHPMALYQCQDFIYKNNFKNIIEASDTARAAQVIQQKQMKGIAAIASRQAAENYGLTIYASNIESDQKNHTRFLVISKQRRALSDKKENKSSLRFEVPDQPGRLVSILMSFVSHKLNMTKLQSVPLMGRPNEYSFHVDLEWDDEERYNKALQEVKSKALRLIEFGEYVKFERNFL